MIERSIAEPVEIPTHSQSCERERGPLLDPAADSSPGSPQEV
eukprot:CAMPEP_0171513028 /NCGR_PEP_ID=MMETSP0959-20130129/1970_1 /TAXON_ID=87120 /ORGANISM="Aurantiochytrium limacinum, Strain ATCCMYA-1381" /LENGTH=41 /DNA_ID= /DNA_START= /DNA_END= /DNA_ORIENTATION=